MTRRAARVKILVAAERARGWSSKPFVLDDGTAVMRRLQQAVSLVRRRGLVDNKVLVAAGFNPRPAMRSHPLSQGRRASGPPSSPPREGGPTAVEVATSERSAPLRNRRATARAARASDTASVGPRPGDHPLLVTR